MQTRQLGDVRVGVVGLGEMPLSIEGRPDESQAMRTIHAALDAGVTLIDTADAYCLNPGEHGHGEAIVAKGLRTYGGDTSDVIVATKAGHLRPGDGSWKIDGRPDYIKQACERSLQQLGVDVIPLYQYHRPDPKVPWGDSVGAIRDLLDAGKIRFAGVSNANPAQIDEAYEILGGRLVSVQNEFSPSFRTSEPELRRCEELGIAFLPWSPLGGIGNTRRLEVAGSPFATVAQEVGTSPQVVCLAWMISKGERVIPIPGSSRPETIRDSATAGDVRLTAEQIARLDAA
jgi:aryl-alcohol dehydrogenase-like predicted oxidoreductase